MRREHLEKDRRMVLDPGEWPKWPLLPMKRRDGGADFCGFLFADGAAQPKLYIGNIWSIGKDKKPKTWKEALEGFKIKQFGSVDELLAEYMVD